MKNSRLTRSNRGVGLLAYKRNIDLLILFRMLSACVAFPISTLVEYWRLAGLNMTEIMFLEAYFGIILAAMIIPSGYFADLFGRKKSLLIGSLSLLLGIVLYVSYRSYELFLLAETCLALGFGFISGADDALLHDSLQELRAPNLFRQIKAKLLRYFFVAVAGVHILGSYILSDIDLLLPFYAEILGLIAMIISVLCMHEPRKIKQSSHSFVQLVDATKELLVRNREVSKILVVSTALMSLNFSGFWLYQDYFMACGFERSFNGVFLAMLSLVAGVVTIWFEKKKGSLDIISVFISFSLVSALGYFAMASYVGQFSPLFLVLHQFLRVSDEVLLSEKLLQVARPEFRATALSVKGMLFHLVVGFIIVPIGWWSDQFGLLSTFYLLSLMTLGSVAGLIMGMKLLLNRAACS